MEIIKFLVANWDSVLVVVGFLALVAMLIKRGETKKIGRASCRERV